MPDFPDLHRAYTKPTESDTDEAWRRMGPKLVRAGAYRMRLLIPAAVLVGLITAFGVGYVTGRRAAPSDRGAPEFRTERPAGIVIRPPELVAKPGS